MGVSRVFRGCFQSVLRVIKEHHLGTSRMYRGYLKVFLGILQVKRVFQGRLGFFKIVFQCRLFHGY